MVVDSSLFVMWAVALAAGGAFGAAFTLLGRKLARRVGLVDAPDGRRKTQARAVPVVGGVAVLAAAVVALAVVALACPDVAAAIAGEARRTFFLLVAAVMITAVGVIDDRVSLRARYKLLGQFAAILVLVVPGGFVIQQLGLLG